MPCYRSLLFYKLLAKKHSLGSLAYYYEGHDGPATLLSVGQKRDGRLVLLIAAGDSIPGPVLHSGNTNSRYRFSIGAKRFMNDWSMAGPAHHCAIGVGLHAAKLEKLAQVLGIDFKRVC